MLVLTGTDAAAALLPVAATIAFALLTACLFVHAGAAETGAVVRPAAAFVAVPAENVATFSKDRHIRTGSRAWITILALGFGIALAVASAFFVNPTETTSAVMARLGW